MLIGRVVISPDSRLKYQIQYPWLEETETVVTVQSVTIEPNDGVFNVDSLIIAPDGKSLAFQASCDGDDSTVGTEYDVKFIINTSAGQTSDDCLVYTIDENC
jgi:hypothetical protein